MKNIVKSYLKSCVVHCVPRFQTFMVRDISKFFRPFYGIVSCEAAAPIFDDLDAGVAGLLSHISNLGL